MKDSIIDRWIREAMNLRPGERLLVPCHTKKDRTSMIRQFKNTLLGYIQISPLVASKLVFLPHIEKTQFYVKIEMRAQSPLVGFKDVEGMREKVTLSNDSDRRRRINLMISDGLHQISINNLLESPLTEDEIQEYFVEN